MNWSVWWFSSFAYLALLREGLAWGSGRILILALVGLAFQRLTRKAKP